MWRARTLACFVLAFAAITASTSDREARAQCGGAASECRTCHEIRGAKPVLALGAWHRDHAFGDFCAMCHGGNPTSKDEASAHVGMIPPLAAVDVACTCCHGARSNDLAARYASTPRPSSAATSSSAAGPPSNQGPSAGAMSRWANVGLATLMLALAAGGAAFVIQNERRRASWRGR